LEERTLDIGMGESFNKSLVVHPYTVVFCAQQWSRCTISYPPHILLWQIANTCIGMLAYAGKGLLVVLEMN
jgi:hypothetical protein